MADGITHPNLKPESISQYDGQYEVKHYHTADTQQKTTKLGVFFKLFPFKVIPKHIIVPSTLQKHEVMRGCFILQILYNFYGFHLKNVL